MDSDSLPLCLSLSFSAELMSADQLQVCPWTVGRSSLLGRTGGRSVGPSVGRLMARRERNFPQVDPLLNCGASATRSAARRGDWRASEFRISI